MELWTVEVGDEEPANEERVVRELGRELREVVA